jgi:hypothetical protein
MSKVRVGKLRPSQLLWAYGPGSLVDLPNLSVITMGLDHWDETRCIPIEEGRLLAAVRKVLGPQVDRLRMPPVILDDDDNPFSAEGKIGVPVEPFPRWLRCIRCGLLAEFDAGHFTIKENPFRPEQTQFLHEGCEKGGSKRKSDAVPARFLLACRNGHLDDFPWHWFVHSGHSNCKGTLRFFERGASLQTENLWVRCDACDAARSLVHAFGKDAKDNLPACRGRHPHLGIYDPDCREQARTVLLGATNGWFPVTVSVLAIPVGADKVAQLVNDGWTYFEDAESEVEVKAILKTLTKSATLAGIGDYAADRIWEAIEAKRSGSSDTTMDQTDIKRPEWEVMTATAPPTDWPHFLATPTAPPKTYAHLIERVVLLERLREVNALLGFTRVEAPEESSAPDERAPMARLCRGKPEWVPASEVYGEGIFLKFSEPAVSKWEKSVGTLRRDKMLKGGHSGWRSARKLDPTEGYPGVRYAMIHTFAHLLIRELALECGYNAASIRERIYGDTEGGSPMAGLLIYTAAADSDGTLGGLVELGKANNLERLISQALERSQICSSDPLCSEHDSVKDRSLHGASCHACGFVPETSCERGNRYLDRALLVPTFDCTDAAFFC